MAYKRWFGGVIVLKRGFWPLFVGGLASPEGGQFYGVSA